MTNNMTADTFKVVINSCYGGFGLSDEAEAMWRKMKNISEEEGVYSCDIARDDLDLIAIVEQIGSKAASDNRFSKLTVVEVPMWVQEKGWHIVEYDGMEHVAENHKTWH